jgi:hypothetical protein
MTLSEKYEESNVDLLGDRKQSWMKSANETWYHGSFSDFNKFSRRKRGENTGANSAKEGFFFASNPEVAISYASDLTQKLQTLNKQFEQLKQEIERLTGDDYVRAGFKLMRGTYDQELTAKVEPIYDRAAEIDSQRNGLDYSYFLSQELIGKLKIVVLEYKKPLELEMDGRDIIEGNITATIKKARKQGHDAVIFRDTYDGGNPIGVDEPTDVAIVFHNSQVIDKKKAVGVALAKGKFRLAISQGRMTTENAVNIIESVHLPVPPEFRDGDSLGSSAERSAAWYRTRLSTFSYFIRNTPYKDEKVNNDIVILRNGVIPNNAPEFYDLEGRIEGILTSGITVSQETLEFSEITCFNTWFEMHSDKVFGKQIVSTSVHFPLTIKGNRTDIENGFAKFLKPASPADSKPNYDHIRLKALALALELELLNL